MTYILLTVRATWHIQHVHRTFQALPHRFWRNRVILCEACKVCTTSFWLILCLPHQNIVYWSSRGWWITMSLNPLGCLNRLAFGLTKGVNGELIVCGLDYYTWHDSINNYSLPKALNVPVNWASHLPLHSSLGRLILWISMIQSFKKETFYLL